MRSLIRQKRGDVRFQVYGASLLLPFDHALPEYVRLYPGYSTNVVRVAEAVSSKYPASPLIDVGANVGDTASFWRARVLSPILAVEGDAHWLPYLRANAGQLPGVSLASVFLGTTAETVAMRADRSRGTSAFVPDDAMGAAVEVCTPQQLLTRFPDFCGARLVKTDTDGHDYSIVRGFLSEFRDPPVYFFEHDPSFGQAGVGQSNELRQALERANYGTTLWWDNFGRFLLAFDLGDEALWNSLTRYVPTPHGAQYWDVAAFPEGDTDVAESLVDAELSRRESTDLISP